MPVTDTLVAFGGGLVSFLSPCVLPLVPAYLSVSGGLGRGEPRLRRGRRALAAASGAGLFIAGFSVVFVALGLSATALGSVLLSHHVPIARAAGLAVLALALFLLMGTMPLSWMPWREVRFHPRPQRLGTWSAPVVGAAFAFGWTPCIGPVLGSVLAMAAGEGSAWQGAALLSAYAAGLGVPFMASALAFDRLLGVRRWASRHTRALTRGAAVVLGAYGALLALDRLAWVTLQLQVTLSALGLGALVRLG